MTASRRSPVVLAFLLVLVAGAASGDALRPGPPRDPATPAVPAAPPDGLRLVSYDSCPDLYARLRTSAAERVGPYGFAGEEVVVPAAGAAREGDAAVPGVPGFAAGDVAADADAFSGTNTHERGVDEPDLIKTDGRRIVVMAVREGVPLLRVIDVATRAQTGELALPGAYGAADLLLSGDRVLVLTGGDAFAPGPDGFAEDPRGWPSPRPSRLDLRLIDLAGAPREIGRYAMDGALVDARQVGATVRVVARSSPRIDLPLEKADGELNRRIVAGAKDDVWLPRFEVTAPDGTVATGTVPCERVSQAASHDGVRMLTMLSLDLAAPALTDGTPVTVVADGDTVYGTADAVYVADGGADSTDIHRFDAGGTGTPRYAASGTVPGRVLHQYALSEWRGHLRVATTVTARNSSSVTVLERRGTVLAVTGAAEDLGRGETIHSVRFIEDRGYVVTFRRTDPLYTVDLSDPARPVVTGELKIPGYSAYLHPAAPGRLIGVGQDATTAGTVTGLQVSLFDVTDPAAPARLAQHRVPHTSSAAEVDPHAFLFRPDTGHLVLPVADHLGAAPSALVLRLSGDAVTEAGTLAHPDGSPITRTLVTGETLWTAGPGGLRAVSLATLRHQAWLPV